MAGNKAGAAKARQTRIEKYGSLEAYLEQQRAAGKKGGSVPRVKPPTNA